MPTVTFTQNIQRHITAPVCSVTGKTVADCLEQVFRSNAGLRGYVLDDQGVLRRHMAIFVDGRQIDDRVTLGDPVADSGEIFVMQALSGG